MKTTNELYGRDTELNMKLIVGLARVTLTHERDTSRFMSERGLTLPQFGVLEVLYHKGDLRVCEIIEKTLSTSGNMTVIIKNLEQEGYIQRICDPADKRAYLISLEPKGQQLMEQIFPEHIEKIDQWVKVLSVEEKETLVEILKKLGRR
jgi:DNA-binding MarR family transcriptional regulator